MSDAVSRDEETIRRLQAAWMAAWVEGDRATLELVLAADFSLIVSARPSQPIPRHQWLQTALVSYRASSFEYESMTVRILGDVAVVASIAVQQAAIDGVDRSGRFFLTDIWRRTKDSWQVVVRYSSHPEPSSVSSQRVTSIAERPGG